MELLLRLDRSAAPPLWRQIYFQIQARILSGELAAGMRLPSSRALSAALAVARNVVLEAYDQLLAEGYLESRPQAGIYVAPGLVLPTSAGSFSPRRHGDTEEETGGLFRPSCTGTPLRPKLIDFRPGLPALDQMPRRIWGRLLEAVCRDAGFEMWGYSAPEGHPTVRASLARYLARARGVRCHPDQIVMTAGAAQAFALVAGICLHPGAVLITEDPMNADLRRRYVASGATHYAVPVDSQGLDVAQIPAGLAPQLIHVTPSHQFPLGAVLPIGRRIALVQLARAQGALIVEDDYDSEVRYSGAPIPALQGLAPEQVIYVGTLSKILAPALRIGYAILPWALVAEARGRKRDSDLHSPTIEQLALARFIDEGHLDRHIVRVRKVARSRRDTLVACLCAHFGDAVQLDGLSTGLHLVAHWPGRSFDEAILAELATAGVQGYLLARHSTRVGCYDDRLVFGYAHLTIDQIAEGVARLASVLKRFERAELRT